MKPPPNLRVKLAARVHWGMNRSSAHRSSSANPLGRTRPATIRKLGGALFCDRRYDTVFVYHNGAESYYAARGFRCSLRA